MTSYVLDTNVFIDAKNIFYDMNVFPAFWDWLELQNEIGKVHSVEHVYKELQGREDELSEWAKTNHYDFFLNYEPAVVEAHLYLDGWAKNSDYQESASHIFLGERADSWLIAYAMAQGGTVVTHEVPSSSKSKIKIPDVCKEHNIKCLNLFEMLKQEKPKFVLRQEQNN